MKDINYTFEDIDEIEFNMDIAVKEVYPELENLTVDPTKEQQVFNHENSYGYDTVTINATPLQDKEITINENGIHNIVADEEFVGLNKVAVTVDAIEELSEELTTYDTELTEQEVTIEDIVEALETKMAPAKKKYAPRYISFYQYEGTELDAELADLDTSYMNSMLNMFKQCTNLTTIDLSNFNTSNTTSMKQMFHYCQSVEILDLSSFDMSNTSDVTYMFCWCSAVKTIKLPKIDNGKYKDLQYMFDHCTNLTTIDLSNFDTSNVTNMSGVFGFCSNLATLDVSNFVTSKVTTMSQMFRDCSNLTTLDLSNFDTTKISNNSSMLFNCSKLITLIINSPNVFKMTNTNMFQSTPIESGTGYVYVPDNMVETYKTATNWSTYANQIKGMSELPMEGV